MKTLFLSPWHPFPPTNGSELRIFNLVSALGERDEVTVLALHNPESRGQEDRPPAGVRVRSVPRKSYRPNSLRALLGLVSRVPRAYADMYDPKFAELIEEELGAHRYDVVIASQLDMSVYHPHFSGQASIFEEIELGGYVTRLAKAGNPLAKIRLELTWRKLKSYLRQITLGFSVSTVVSDLERRLLADVLPNGHQVEVIPNGVHLDDCLAVERFKNDRPTLIFPGAMTYSANYDAMAWFVTKVLPAVRAAAPTVRLMITGNPGRRALPSEDSVELTGFVEDVRPLVASADVCVVPVRQGGGTRLKILEAMALGTPIVATSKGAEGLNVEEGVHLLMEDRPADFAKAVLRLLQDKPLQSHLVSSARDLVAREYDWSVILPRFVELVKHVGLGAGNNEPRARDFEWNT